MQNSPLDAEIGAYKGRYGVTNKFFYDLLGKDGKPLSKNSFLAKRRGDVEFTYREVKVLARTLGLSIDEISELLPEINHE